MVIKSNKKNKSVYGSGPQAVADERHTLSILVDNEPGVLARVIGLFSGRGYNIESLTVAEISEADNHSRITIVSIGTPQVIQQIKSQLERLIPIHKVTDLTVEGPHVERELALIKVAGTGEMHDKALRIAEDFQARIIDTTDESYVFELTESANKIDNFIELMSPLGLVDISRTGTAAISRGKDPI